MQSFIQYRKFRSTVEAQHAGAGEKIQNDRREERQSRPEPSQSPSGSEDKDLEKGDSSHSSLHGDVAAAEPAGVGASHPVSQDFVTQARKTEREGEEAAGEVPQEEAETPPAQEYVDYDLRQHLSRLSTQQSGGTRLGNTLTGVDVRKRSTNEGGDGNVFIVGYHDDKDPANPHNWSYAVRIYITFAVASIGFVVGVASSIDSAALTEAAQEFGVSEVVESMATGKSSAYATKGLSRQVLI